MRNFYLALASVFAVTCADYAQAAPKVEQIPTETVKPEVLTSLEDIAVLAPKDVRVYKRLFKYQRRLQRDKVVANLKYLNDKVLYGHLVAERLMHPRTRASYEDLTLWLSRYNDHHQAKTLYKLAKKRKPRSSAAPVKPKQSTKSMARYSDPDARPKSSKPKLSKSQARTKKYTLRRLKRYRLRGEFTRAETILNKEKTLRLFGEELYASVSLKLARTMLNEGALAGAQRVAINAVQKSVLPQPEGLWIAGFASYRLKDFEESAKTLRKLTFTVDPNSKYYAKAAWWAHRAYEQIERNSMSNVFLKMAAQDPASFYGQLATAKMGQSQQFSWDWPELKKSDFEVLKKDPGIRRAIALAQMGEKDLAQKEFRHVYPNVPYDMDDALLALALMLDLPNTAMVLSFNLKEREDIYMAGLYPVSNTWKPRDGFKMDKALMNAIIRQESAFKPSVRSRAGARGLMQVMPQTARYIRHKQGKRMYSKAWMTRPDVNLSLGQFYINYLSEEFDNNIVHMIAAYNGGPGNARKWIRAMPEDVDPMLFIESIPFVETRNYVIKVVSNLWIYRHRLYGEAPSLQAMAFGQWPTQVAMNKAPKTTF